MASERELLMHLENLSVNYRTRRGWVSAVDDVTMDIYKGEVLGLVGESGSGKSTLGKALMRLNPRSARVTGKLMFLGEDLMTYSNAQMRRIRGDRISMVFQDPMTSLNPIQRIVNHITETIRTHQPQTPESEAVNRAKELVDVLGISDNRLDDYPHQLSGGMRQRIMIALGLALNADLIIADEATTSLDVIVEAQFMALLKDLCREFNLTILLITHNIGLVAQLADRVAVMYAGRLAEVGPVETIFKDPQHPYTRGLLGAVPTILLDDHEELYRMEGSPPDLIAPPPGCRFHPRCKHAMDVCKIETPVFKPIENGNATSCWLYDDIPAEFTGELLVSAQEVVGT
ncbi:MAG: ABC transporter ATP-binding protein [Chloroflexi bacterium]|nr:ABC transporter ATP-binding protein [Chloroflexota bacterium]